ncbi:MAG TPA: GNAT family N-acetyltransferase [Candidatus Gastranaerophilales bacterium]|nr:GNAT family N-acetyltransferase [Candidatus Gastranaerophilales bacterium]
MQVIEQINTENCEKIREIYEDFRNKALSDYQYSSPPIEFEQFKLNIENNFLKGLVLFENANPLGILIFYKEKHQTIEVNVIHANQEENECKIRYALLEALVKHLQDKNDWKVISYAMLGKQEAFVNEITNLNFKLVGQSIVKFDFKSPVAFRVFKNAEIPESPDYKLAIWNEKHKEQVIELINLAFKNTKNANFDSRLLTKEGSEEVLNMILTNQYGSFLPSQSRLLLLNGNVEGFCLTTMVTQEKINIPLIAIRKNERNKGMGKFLLKSVLAGFVRLITENKILLSEINATTDTDNYPAVKMYRRLGFKEESFYPHAFLKNNLTE